MADGPQSITGNHQNSQTVHLLSYGTCTMNGWVVEVCMPIVV
jgi:hypothetical protein